MTVEFDKESTEKFKALLLEMQETTKAEMPKVIRNATRDFIFKAIAETPISERFTKILPIVDYRPGSKMYGKVIFRRVNRNIPIKGRGFAKACWIKALRTVGIPPPNQWHDKAKRKAERFGDGIFRDLGEMVEYEIANQCPYIEDLDKKYRIGQKALNETNVKMERILTKLSQKLASKWK